MNRRIPLIITTGGGNGYQRALRARPETAHEDLRREGGNRADERARRLRQPLQDLINTYAYGDVWSRPGLDNRSRSLAVLAMTAALNRPAEFSGHVRGAIANGCTPEEIREVLLLIGIYCGIPAANDAHRLAIEAMGTGR